MAGALSTQPEEYLDHLRSVPSKDHIPSIDEQVEEYLLLGEVSGMYQMNSGHVRSSVEKQRLRGLVLSFIAMVFVSLANKVLQKLETIPMYNYPIFLNLFTTFMYVPFSFAYIIPMVCYGSVITLEQTQVPKRVFAVIGCLDGVAGIMQLFGATYLSGSLIILLIQAAIPISMVISKRLTNATYSLVQYAGAAFVTAGILIVIGPSLSSGDGGGGKGDGQQLLWSLVLVISCVPMVLSNVYKEIALEELELDPIYLNGWIALFQSLFAIPLMVPAGLTTDPPVSLPHLPGKLWDGWLCYLGKNSILEGPHPDNCWPGAPLYVSLYLIVNVSFNVLVILILKYGNASILFLALTVMVPLGNIVFAFPFVPGHAPIHATDVIGLFFVVSGLVTYRFGEQIIPRLRAALASCLSPYFSSSRSVNGFFGGGDKPESGHHSEVHSRARGHAMPLFGGGGGAGGQTQDLHKPLLDLAEAEGEDGDWALYQSGSREVGGESIVRGQFDISIPRRTAGIGAEEGMGYGQKRGNDYSGGMHSHDGVGSIDITIGGEDSGEDGGGDTQQQKKAAVLTEWEM